MLPALNTSFYLTSSWQSGVNFAFVFTQKSSKSQIADKPEAYSLLLQILWRIVCMAPINTRFTCVCFFFVFWWNYWLYLCTNVKNFCSRQYWRDKGRAGRSEIIVAISASFPITKITLFLSPLIYYCLERQYFWSISSDTLIENDLLFFLFHSQGWGCQGWRASSKGRDKRVQGAVSGFKNKNVACIFANDTNK